VAAFLDTLKGISIGEAGPGDTLGAFGFRTFKQQRRTEAPASLQFAPLRSKQNSFRGAHARDVAS